MGSQWFTVLDQGKAHHQGNVSESSKPVTAFVTPWGLYEWNRIPFGLTGAPGRFQKYMNEILNDYRGRFCIPYLDDIIIYSSTFEGHLDHLGAVLRRLNEKGIEMWVVPQNCTIPRMYGHRALQHFIPGTSTLFVFVFSNIIQYTMCAFMVAIHNHENGLWFT